MSDATIAAFAEALLGPLRDVGTLLAQEIDRLRVRVEALENEAERVRERMADDD